MARNDQVVPIDLLHRLVYPSGRRLTRWVPLVVPKKEIIVKPPPPSNIEPFRTFSATMPHYSRRFFVKLEGIKVLCRWCGGTADTFIARGDHNGCFRGITQALANLRKKDKCIVCGEDAADSAKLIESYSNIPVCSETCMAAWDLGNPMDFKVEITLLKNSLSSEGYNE